MASRSFPDAYIGGVPAFAGTRGHERWDLERRQARARHEQALQAWLSLEREHIPLRLSALAQCHLDLALISSWEGQAEQAHQHMAACAEATLQCIEQALPKLDPTNYCALALDGAMAAALVDRHELAQTLFTYAERFAAGLVTEADQQPARRWVSLAPFIDDAIVHAYSLLRLGRLSGFHAMLYPVAFPEARKVAPAWAAGDIGALLATIDTAIAVARARRDPMDLWNSKKYLLPVLGSLQVCLEESPAGTEAQAHAALTKYYGMIRNLADFPAIYLRVLDLQKAYPQIYPFVAPTVFSA